MILRAACAALLALAAAPAQSPPSTAPVEAALRQHVAALADDSMEGRRPGSRAGERAARYILGAMKAAGLSPGAANGEWYQRVSLIERKPVSAQARWRVADVEVPIAVEELALLARSSSLRLNKARLIFGGYGLDANFEGVDVAGAILLLLPGKPRDAPGAPSYDARRSALIGRGAAGVITLVAGETSWKGVRAQYGEGRTMLASDPVAILSGAMAPSAWRRLLGAAGGDARSMDGKGFRATPIGEVDLHVRTRVRRYRSVNVVGRLEGAATPEEAVLYTAHWDHLGICRPATASDRICNGAVDNASGVASMIETARALAAGPRPGRSLLFVATTAEELGLLGARAFVLRPPVPLQAIRAALNLDTVAIAPAGAPVAIIGRGRTSLDAVVDNAARALGRKVDRGTAANAFLTRQDGWVLLEAGIPAVMVGGAFADAAAWDRFFASRYHMPSDDLAGIELGGAAEDVALHVALGRILADPVRFPSPAR